MQAMISSEFLIEPAFSCKDFLQKSVRDIIKINKMVNNNYDVDIIVQDELISKLSDAGLYPSEKVFNENIIKHGLDDEISSKDIVTMIHNIVQRSDDLSSYTEVFEIEFENVNIIPDKNEITYKCCMDDLIYDFMMVILINEIYKFNLKIIFSLSNKIKDINLQTGKVIIYADEQSEIKGVDTSFALSSVDELLLDFGSINIWAKTNNEYTLSLAIYTRVLELRKQSGITYDDDFNLDSFVIGDGFINSLYANQCGPNERFGSACFDAISRLISGSPKEALSVFRVSSEKNAAQRTRGLDLAFRTHVTKGSEGIRLMVWALPTGEYELANVGNKFELNIQG
ncbi:hypothetical protein BCU85_07670 [Vibrio lentus]|uniref:hypothetical protein n=1 Tax=Vibrio lentus TaxID=136468 RepID=UPI000C8167B0|nr:hypothetical protein [Vibrio lentus]MCC4818490.1 hypothetical protein [Vibrio lentus]PMG68573.1 hypothetical protein BCU85_07670 [Vibrio lentus]PMK89564.1 hypothetical protein BCT88_22015 [Vibrio lentus]PML27171.1 hypothetical protein BCT80_01165 [Vibrio lentus]PMM25725.1 hypothetical protein BCT57_21150 [Vibrio lentus]